VKIATAITKFMRPLISYPTPLISKRLFTIKVNIKSTIPLITKLTSPKNIKKRGSDNIFITGRIVALIIPSIIPPVI